jgi:hypothetical protein
MGKAKQKNVKKTSDVNKSVVPGGCVYFDISTVKSKKGEPKVAQPNWRIMVDERTDMKFSHFFAKKNGMYEPTCKLINKWKDMKIELKCIRMDNAGENKSLQQKYWRKDWQFEIMYAYTAIYTQQHNHLAEL